MQAISQPWSIPHVLTYIIIIASAHIALSLETLKLCYN